MHLSNLTKKSLEFVQPLHIIINNCNSLSLSYLQIIFSLHGGSDKIGTTFAITNIIDQILYLGSNNMVYMLLSNIDLKAASGWLKFTLLSCLFALNSCNCISYDKDVAWIESLYPPTPAYSPNPKFIFDMPKNSNRTRHISSEQFKRNPWPVSPEAHSYISQDDTITYREYYTSDQYVNGSGKARDRYHLRSRSYRSENLSR